MKKNLKAWSAVKMDASWTRVEHALALLHQNPTPRLCHAAADALQQHRMLLFLMTELQR